MGDQIKQEVLIDVQVEQDDAAFTKLASLKSALVGLKNERKALDEALKKETITQKEYYAEVVRVEALQKRISAQYNQTQRQVTGLKNPFDKLNESIKNQTKLLGGAIPALDKVSGGAASAATGIFSMVRAAAAFIATPLGLVLTAVGLAFAPFVAFLTQTGEGADIVTREMEGFKSVLQKVRDELVKTGKEQQGFFTGALASLRIFIPELGNLIDSYNEAAKEGRDYADSLDEIADAQENASIQVAKDENEIKRLILQSKNRTLSEKERIDLLQRALTLESQIVQQRTTFAQDEFSALVERNRERLKGVGIIQKEGETQEDFAQNNIDAIRKLDEPLAKSLIESLKKLEEAKASGIAIEEKAQNQLDAIQDKADEKAKKRQEEKFKASEEERKQRIEDYDAKLEQNENEIITAQERADFDAELDQVVKDGFLERAKTFSDQQKKQQKATLEFEKGVGQARRDLAGQLGLTLLQLAGKNKILATAGVIIERAASIANIIANTAAANAKAIKASPLTLGQPWVGVNTASGLLGVTSVLASAAQSISAINSAKGFATGGRVSGNPNIRRSNGDDMLITAKRGEVILNERQQAALGGYHTFRKIGVPGFATGGVVGNETRLATANATAQVDFNQLLSGINRIQTVLVLDDLRSVENTVDGINRRATVVG